MEIVLVRHTSVGVPKGTCYGWSDVPVAATFETEAAETKRRLGTEPFDAVYSSPLTRARKLAAYCGWPSPVVDDRLKEMNMGDWEMKLFDEIEDENLYRALLTVDKRTLQIVLLKMQGYSLKEIAPMVDLSAGAVYARLDHQRKKLRKLL